MARGVSKTADWFGKMRPKKENSISCWHQFFVHFLAISRFIFCSIFYDFNKKFLSLLCWFVFDSVFASVFLLILVPMSTQKFLTLLIDSMRPKKQIEFVVDMARGKKFLCGFDIFTIGWLLSLKNSHFFHLIKIMGFATVNSTKRRKRTHYA